METKDLAIWLAGTVNILIKVLLSRPLQLKSYLAKKKKNSLVHGSFYHIFDLRVVIKSRELMEYMSQGIPGTLMHLAYLHGFRFVLDIGTPD